MTDQKRESLVKLIDIWNMIYNLFNDEFSNPTRLQQIINLRLYVWTRS